MPDSRIFQKDFRTRRNNVVNLPRSGAFGKPKTIDKGYFGGPKTISQICPCELGIGCFKITDPSFPDPCDFIVWPDEYGVIGISIINDDFIINPSN